jgi:tetratricopeptide (TPR) repeat protein
MNEASSPSQGDGAATWHISAELCRRFLEGRVSAPERRAVVRHLITECPQCIALMGRISTEAGYWTGKGGADEHVDRDYTEAFQAAFKFATHGARRLAVERLRGWAHWSALDPLLPDERLATVIMRKDWQHWGLFRALLDAAHWYLSRDPQEAADIAALALDITDLLDPMAVGGEAAAGDVRAQAWVLLADCRRLAADLDGARAAITEAWKWNEAGAGNTLDKARIYIADASYAAMAGEFETAVAILERALRLYRGAADPHLQGRTLVQMARTIGYANPDRGIAHLEEALDLINPVREPRLALCAEHYLAEFLCGAGRPEEALAILDRIRSLYRQFPDEWAQLRLHWLEGRIIHALGQFAEAADILHQVQEELRARDLRQEYLLVAIDLAEAHVALGGTATALRLVSEVMPRLASWQPHRSTLGAWLLFEKALEEASDAREAGALFARLRLYLRRYWNKEAEFIPRSRT